MNCPSCNQEASSFLRSLSLEGVSFLKSMQGYFKCQHCGTLLRITSYGKQFWFFYIPAVVVAVLWALFPGLTVVWLPLLVLVFIGFAGLQKFAQVQKVDAEDHSTTTPAS
jgi:hypothetical protein